MSSSNTPGHVKFIIGSSDWRSPQNNNLWQGVNGINNPCPEGFRIPTAEEWDQERESWNYNSLDGAFASPLKLTMTGVRNGTNGTLYDVGSDGYYWSGTVNGANARFLNLSNVITSMNSSYRLLGLSVRCIKD